MCWIDTKTNIAPNRCHPTIQQYVQCGVKNSSARFHATHGFGFDLQQFVRGVVEPQDVVPVLPQFDARDRFQWVVRQIQLCQRRDRVPAKRENTFGNTFENTFENTSVGT